MRTFAQNQPQRPVSFSPARPNMATHMSEHSEYSILHAQRTIGSQFVPRMLRPHTEELAAGLTATAALRFGHDFGQIPIHPPAAGAIQTKLASNKPKDEYEQKADHFANEIMRMPEPQLGRACACGGRCPTCQTKRPGHALGTLTGRQLDTVTRRDLEVQLPPRRLGPPPAGLSSPADTHERDADVAAGAVESGQTLGGGHDLSDVRIHDDAESAAAAARLGADAFTIGRDIYFGDGRYRPDSVSGRRLIAHEVAHVIQQRGSVHATLQRQASGAAPPPAAPAGRLANEQERKIITQAEITRLSLLSKALPLVMDLLTAITTGDPSVTLNPRGAKPKPTDKPGLEVTKRAAIMHLNIRPNTYDWLNDPKDREALATISVAARLMAGNLGHAFYPKRVMDTPAGGRAPDPCAPGEAAHNDGTTITLQPDFFVSGVAPMPSVDCPGIILMHEYFHHLVVNPQDPPRQQGRVFHGQPAPGRPTFAPESVKYALHDAYSLTSFAAHVALGHAIECVCPDKDDAKK